MSTLASPQQAVHPSAVQPRHAPLWNLVLLDDNDHTYSYVVEMLSRLFGYGVEKSFRLACEVDSTGRVIVATLAFEYAEFKQQQIHAFGRDWRLEQSRGSMSAILEPRGDC